jgi:CheY-like chemotaxis protein
MGYGPMCPLLSGSAQVYRRLRSIVVTTLIVDDEPDMRLLIGMSLTLDGACEVTAEAENGEAALAAWEKERPDVVVLDMRMPGMTGLDVARRIFEKDPTQPIVLCSAYLDQEDRDEAKRIGVLACVDKTDMGKLAQVVVSVARAA